MVLEGGPPRSALELAICPVKGRRANGWEGYRIYLGSSKTKGRGVVFLDLVNCFEINGAERGT